VTKTYETVFTTLRDWVMSVRSEAPRLRDVALTEGVAGVRGVLDKALSEALQDVGSVDLVGKPAAA
jgi:hypothetical protein